MNKEKLEKIKHLLSYGDIKALDVNSFILTKTGAEKIINEYIKVSRVELPVKPEIADVGRITMWVDMIWNDIFDDDELPLTAAQMNIVGKYINDAKEMIRKQFSV